MKYLMVLSVLLYTCATQAKTDTKAAVEQLKINAENSDANYKQYQDNMDIVNNNVVEAQKAINELEKLKKQLVLNTKNVGKNKMGLEKMEKDILLLKAKENERILAEDKQIAQTKALLEKLEANKKKREENQIAYDKMVEQVKLENAQWDEQVKQMDELLAQIDAKTNKANAEKQTWVNKRKDYEEEATKWKKESLEARESYNKLQKVK
jgi:hypothetical protein